MQTERVHTVMPLSIAWETFGLANGVELLNEMKRHVQRLRQTAERDDRVGCVVLSDVVLFAEEEWVEGPRDWKPQTVRIAGYDLTNGEGARGWNALTAVAREPEKLQLSVAGSSALALARIRRGQGAFRRMVMDAYERRCAVSGEKTSTSSMTCVMEFCCGAIFTSCTIAASSR